MTYCRYKVQAVATFVSVQAIGIRWILDKSTASFAAGCSIVIVVTVPRLKAGTFVYEVLTICVSNKTIEMLQKKLFLTMHF